MTATELAQYTDRRGTLRDRGTGLTWDVDVIDARERFGTLDFRIVPVAGSGTAWVEAARVTLAEDGPVSGILP